MDLTVKEAAELMEISARAVRAQLESGKLTGKKKGGKWIIPRKNLPLGKKRAAQLNNRAHHAKQMIEREITKHTGRERSYRSVMDVMVFVHTADFLAQVRAPDGQAATLSTGHRNRLTRWLEAALGEIAESVHQYDNTLKLVGLNRARTLLARSAALLLSGDKWPPSKESDELAAVIEAQILPPLSGLARWVDQQRNRERHQ